MLMEILDRQRVQFMKDAADLHARVGTWVTAILTGDQEVRPLVTHLTHIRRVVVTVAQQKAQLPRQFLDECGGRIVVSGIGQSQVSRQNWYAQGEITKVLGH